jgi:hypothetical protein
MLQLGEGTMVLPWEQLPGESSKAYAAFCLYRDQGLSRSMEATSRVYHSHSAQLGSETATGRRRGASGQIRLWAERWNWSARARAWDQELERVKWSKQVEASAEMAERHAKEALMLQNKAVERLRLLRPEELGPRETLSYLIEAAKLERLARGEPTERVAEEHRFTDVKELTDDELARIVASRRGLSSPGGRGAAAEKEGPEKLL